jgi:hypothetical protein
MNHMIKYWNMTDNESHDQILEYDWHYHFGVFDLWIVTTNHVIHCQSYSSIWSCDSLSVIFQYLIMGFIVSHIPVFDHGIHCKSYSSILGWDSLSVIYQYLIVGLWLYTVMHGWTRVIHSDARVNNVF